MCQLLLVVHIWVHCHSLSSERSREWWGDTKELRNILWGCSVHAFGLELGEYRTCEVVFGWSPACADGVDGGGGGGDLTESATSAVVGKESLVCTAASIALGTACTVAFLDGVSGAAGTWNLGTAASVELTP